MKATRHGSRTSTTHQFLAAVEPKWRHSTEIRLLFNYQALLSKGFFPTIRNSHLILRVTLTTCQLRQATIDTGINLEKITDL